uniref:Uncharacterized protein n=1 Tax=Anguilla anguilla TaxID=7936 RepID=A0A0E9U5K2_ANGAN
MCMVYLSEHCHLRISFPEITFYIKTFLHFKLLCYQCLVKLDMTSSNSLEISLMTCRTA